MSTPAENRFAPPKSHVADAEDDAPAELASRLRRLGAWFLNGLIGGIPLIPGYVKMWPAILQAPRNGNSVQILLHAIPSGGVALGVGIFVDVILAVVQIVFIYKYSASIGKRLVGIKVVRSDGSPASFSRYFWLRGFVNYLITLACRLIPVIGILYGLVDILFIFGSPRRCIHDYIADTIVVKA
jgi:uncharacterized RDD family membrane protein YckC